MGNISSVKSRKMCLRCFSTHPGKDWMIQTEEEDLSESVRESQTSASLFGLRHLHRWVIG